MKSFLNLLKGIFFFLFTLAVLFVGIWGLRFRGHHQDIQTGVNSYQEAEIASTIASKKELFNQALSSFLDLDLNYHPRLGSGKLEYDIGNTYFQLEQYPLAILYYKRAEQLMPRNEVVTKNLSLARQKLGLKESENHPFWEVFLLKNLSLPERLQIFSVLALLVLFLFSMWIWTKEKKIWYVGMFFLIPLLLILINLGICYYLLPTEAVLIRAVEIRRDAGQQFAKVGDQPILGGTVLEILETSSDGRWLKVREPGGQFGYVPAETTKIISF
jgi:tetratricopeptide (TPR) repeat protein